MATLMDMTMEELLAPEGYACSCGRTHRAGLLMLKIGSGALRFLPEALKLLQCKKPFVFCDENTYKAAGYRVEAALKQANAPFALFQFPQAHVEPDEHAVAQLAAAMDADCDLILSVGSGVITDCGKVLAQQKGLRQLAVATAPSMDGYASNSSSMIYHRVKVSAYNACPQVILADTDVLKTAPDRMLRAGLGDMLAKSIALCEWRISHIVTGEYYCAEIAGLMRKSLNKIVDAAPKLLARDEQALEAVAEGLVLSGLAMAFAEVSRPASGLEHYFSHLWEMFALLGGETPELHGLQVGVGTALTLKILERLQTMRPDAQTMAQSVAAFNEAAWERDVRRVFGVVADELIEKEKTLWHKNDLNARRERFKRIEEHWDEILAIMAQELPGADETIALMLSLGLPTTPGEVGATPQQARDAFLHSRDIRDKYLTSSMLWDMGLLDEFAQDELLGISPK
ncbi:MAG TPA: sn-glycerol-1-phosphate dehydrogenase [Candidatus Limiplasma sp.]|nr:sn-glycerol-1-phosphate dehydrogenase [Candidatus Limiplasma sp.]HRX09785.1 sn-glycerol-1-phosphate dehydrogenase [Candidatus Limiplasma sp.]